MGPQGKAVSRASAQLAAELDLGDLDLARRALAGTADARRELVERLVCVPRMLAALNARAGRPLGPADLEDLAQDVLVALWRGLPTYAGLSSLESWAFRSCHRALLGRLRRPRRTTAAGETLEAIASAEDQVFEEIHRALDRLEPRERRLIELKHFEELTFTEIGARLSLSPNTVKSRYYETIAALRRILGARGSDA